MASGLKRVLVGRTRASHRLDHQLLLKSLAVPVFSSAVPAAAQHKVAIALGLVGLLTLANLRGVKEAGAIFALPTYGFVAMVYLTLAVGFARCMSRCPQASTAGLPLEPELALALFLILRAFSSGATALTGVEAIADGVQAFRRPQAKNAAATLAINGSDQHLHVPRHHHPGP